MAVDSVVHAADAADREPWDLLALAPEAPQASLNRHALAVTNSSLSRCVKVCGQ